MFIDGLHTLEELRVERYVVGQGRQFGLYVLGHLLHLGRSIRFEQVEKNTFDPRKQPALTIERTIVLLKVGLAGLFTIASISARDTAIAASNAGS